jgi:hypothetical protein
MLIYNDIVAAGKDVCTDSYPITTTAEGAVLIVETKVPRSSTLVALLSVISLIRACFCGAQKVTIGGESFDTGGNARFVFIACCVLQYVLMFVCNIALRSKEEEEEKVDDEKKTVINLVEAHSLQAVKLEAKEYKALMGAYYKDLLAAINKAKEEILFPEGKAPTDKEELKKAEEAAAKKVCAAHPPCPRRALLILSTVRGIHSELMAVHVSILILTPPDTYSILASYLLFSFHLAASDIIRQ